MLGEIISGDEEEGDEEEDEDEDTFMQKQREKLEAEKEAILNNKNLIAEVSLSCIYIPIQWLLTQLLLHFLSLFWSFASYH